MFIIFGPEIPLLVIYSKEIIRQICKNSIKYIYNYCENRIGVPVSADWHAKSLEVLTTVLKTRKKLTKLKISKFSQINLRIKFIGQITALKFGETAKYRALQLRSVYRQQKPLESITGRNTLMVILTNCWRLSVDPKS